MVSVTNSTDIIITYMHFWTTYFNLDDDRFPANIFTLCSIKSINRALVKHYSSETE